MLTHTWARQSQLAAEKTDPHMSCLRLIAAAWGSDTLLLKQTLDDAFNDVTALSRMGIPADPNASCYKVSETKDPDQLQFWGSIA